MCLIGLFAIRTAIAALVLTIIFLIFIALFHISLNSALDPLLAYLPKSLEAEEESLLNTVENGNTDGSVNGKDEKHDATNGVHASTNGLAAPHQKPNMFKKWLRPDIFTDYQTMRRLVPQGFADIVYEPEIERNAYYNPAITSTPQLLWIPKDAAGVSRQEVKHTSEVIPITDEGAYFDEKNKIVWDTETGRPPIYEEKIYY